MTAETATALPVLVVVTIALTWGLTLAVTQARLVDLSRDGARMLARGESEAAVLRETRSMAPAGSDVVIEGADDVVSGSSGFARSRRPAESRALPDGAVRVTVRAEARIDLPLLRRLPAVALQANAVADVEGGEP
ncbi:TadE family type IV pilus minor pilin [Mumia flava]|uniref:TadE family type IV pilus minor pilin n=1 Tax=Mumia flava TaxID=1348852 RepID=UPI0012FE5D66|nr:TadE family type IV pilus minor pilin [Mumia flava]